MTVRECASEVAQILGDKDMERILKMDGELEDDDQVIVNRYLNGLNIAVDTIASRYYTSVREVNVRADEENRIDYDSLASRVYEIVSVKDSLTGQGVDYYTLPFCLYVPNGNKEYSVRFKFLPEKIRRLFPFCST